MSMPLFHFGSHPRNAIETYTCRPVEEFRANLAIYDGLVVELYADRGGEEVFWIRGLLQADSEGSTILRDKPNTLYHRVEVVIAEMMPLTPEGDIMGGEPKYDAVFLDVYPAGVF